MRRITRLSDSLVGRLVLVTIAAGAATAILGGLVLGTAARSTLQDEILTRNAALAQELATRFDAAVDSATTTLNIVATNLNLARLDPDAASDLRAALRASPLFDELVLFNVNGRPIAAAAAGFAAEAADYEVRAELAREVVADGRHVDVIHTFPPSLELAVPVEHPPGRPVGFLLARLPLEVLAAPIQQVSSPLTPVRFLVDDSGRILVHPERDRIADGEVFPIDDVLGMPEEAGQLDLEEEAALVAAARTTQLDGAVVLQHGVVDALALVRWQLGQLVLILVGVVAAAVLAVSIGGSVLLRPVGALVDAVQRLGRGERGVRAGVQAKGEITLLANEFDRMAETLDRRGAALEELQRLALLVSAVLDRDRLATELVQGAQMLLQADGSIFTTVDDAGESSTVARTGAVADPDLVRRAIAELAGQGSGALLHGDADIHAVSLPVTTLAGTLLGVLTAVRSQPAFADEEVQLAEAFAAFAGVALDNAHRLELEHALVNELQESIERKRVLIGSVTHEFRTPLTCIEGFSDTLLDRWSTFSDEERRNLVAKVSTHAQDLDRLVTQLLDFAVTERGLQAASVTQVPLRPAISSALATLQPLLGERPIIMDVPDVDVLADPLLLRRALGNLFSNAVKYSPPDTPITLRAAQEGDTVRVEVTDEGPGLSEDDLEHAFEPFWRAADNRTRGAGLGLTLVAEYVRAMGGSTGVVSEPHRGSTFFFTLSTAAARQVGA